jgi:hypothetical protein
MASKAQKEYWRILKQRSRANNPEREKLQYYANIDTARERCRKRTAEWRARNPGYSKKWREQNPEAYERNTAASRAAYHANPELSRDRALKRKFGLTYEQKQAMVSTQNGRCRICQELLQPGRRTHVDHDHASGKVRGILCSGCNTGLGGFRDNPNFLREAARYVELNFSCDLPPKDLPCQ